MGDDVDDLVKSKPYCLVYDQKLPSLPMVMLSGMIWIEEIFRSFCDEYQRRRLKRIDYILPSFGKGWSLLGGKADSYPRHTHSKGHTEVIVRVREYKTW